MKDSKANGIAQSSVSKSESVASGKRSNQVKVSLNSEELESLDSLVARMGSDRSSVFRHLLNLSSQNDSINENLEENQSGPENTPSLSSIHFSKSSDKNNNANRVVHFFVPSSFDEIAKIVELIEEGSITILNLKLMDADQSQRAIDFVNGALFGLKGHQQQIDEGIFVFAPSSTELISYFQEEFDISSDDVSEASVSKIIKGSSKGDVAISAVISSFLLTHLHHVLLRAEQGASKEGRSSYAENFARLRTVLCSDAKRIKTDPKDSQSTFDVESPLDLLGEMDHSDNPAICAEISGACSANPGPGGWGVLIRCLDSQEVEFGGFNPETTNNRMVLIAATKAFITLRDYPLSKNFYIKTDSKYLFDGFDKWLNNWKKKGWLTASGKPVLNQDLWKALDAARIEGVTLKNVRHFDNDKVNKVAIDYSENKKLLKLDV